MTAAPRNAELVAEEQPRSARVLRDGGGEAGAQGAMNGCGGTGRLGGNPPLSAPQLTVKQRRPSFVLRDGGDEAGAQGALGCGGAGGIR